MALIDTFMRQRCVYWAPAGTDDSGNPKYEDPVELKCRWEDNVQEYMDPAGNRMVSNAQVFVPVKVETRGVLWRGRYDDVEDYTDPFANPDAYEIRRYTEQPNIRATKFLRSAWL